MASESSVRTTLACLLGGVVALVLIAFVVVVILSFTSRGGFDAARVLPPDTPVYVRVANLPEVWDQLEKSGALETLRRALLEANVGLDEDDLAEYEEMARKVRSLHLGLLGVRRAEHGAPAPTFVLLADIGRPVPLDEFLPDHARSRLERTGEHADFDIYQPELTEDAGPFLASAQGKFVVASDGAVLEEVLDALVKGRRHSLAANKAFRRVRSVAGAEDVAVYVSVPKALELYKEEAPPAGRKLLEAAEEGVGLKHVTFAALTLSHGLTRASARLLVDPGSPVYNLLEQPAIESDIADCLPDTALFYVRASVGDGREALSRLRRTVSRAMRKIDNPAAARVAETWFREAEEAAEIRFDDAAKLIEEIGVFADGSADAPSLCVFAKVDHVPEAERLTRRAVENLTPHALRRDSHGGVDVYRAGDTFAWATLENRLLLGNAEILQRAIDAKRWRSLADSGAYRDLADALPTKSCHAFYLNVERLIDTHLSGRERTTTPRESIDLAKLFDGFTCAGRLQVDEGVLELTVVSSKEVETGELLVALLEPLLRAARREAARARSAGNLKQIAQASTIWLLKHGRNTLYPPSLKALYDSQVMTEPKVFLLPADPSPLTAGAFISDYDSIFDRARSQLDARRMPKSGVMLAWEKKSAYRDGGRNVVFFDARVEYVTPAKFAEHLRQVDRAIGQARVGRPGW